MVADLCHHKSSILLTIKYLKVIHGICHIKTYIKCSRYLGTNDYDSGGGGVEGGGPGYQRVVAH